MYFVWTHDALAVHVVHDLGARDAELGGMRAHAHHHARRARYELGVKVERDARLAEDELGVLVAVLGGEGEVGGC